MAFSPACTACTAWLPLMQPSAPITVSLCSRLQNFSAPSRASECSMCTEPRRRTTSAAL